MLGVFFSYIILNMSVTLFLEKLTYMADAL